MRTASRSLAVFLCVALIWLPLSADVLFLKDGREIQGSDTQIGEQTVSIVTDSGIEEYPISQFDHVVRETSQPITDNAAIAEPAIPSPDITTPAKDPSSSGECLCTPIIENMLEEKESQRIRSGTLSLIGGTVMGVLIAAADGFSELGTMLGLATFVVVGVPGALSLALPSKTERNLEEILAVQGEDRERTCVIELARMSEQGRRSRYLSAISNGALALLGYASGWSTLPTYYVVQAARAALLPSEEEEAFAHYQQLAGVLK